MMKRKMIIFTILSTLLGGCRTHEYCEYKGVQKDVLDGSFWIYVMSTKTEEKKGKKKRAKHGFPYKVVVGFSINKSNAPKYKNWKSFSLTSFSATGVDTKKKLTFDGWTKEFSRIGTAGFNYHITDDMGVTYEAFDIEAEIKIILADGTEKSEHIKVRLEKDYKKKRQSDTWDYLKSM